MNLARDQCPERSARRRLFTKLRKAKQGDPLQVPRCLAMRVMSPLPSGLAGSRLIVQTFDHEALAVAGKEDNDDANIVHHKAAIAEVGIAIASTCGPLIVRFVWWV